MPLPLTLDVLDFSYSLLMEPARQSVGTCMYILSFLLPGCNLPLSNSRQAATCIVPAGPVSSRAVLESQLVLD